MGRKTSQMECALLIYHKCNQHSAGFRSGPFRDHSGPNSGMALFRQNKWSPEWQFWQDSLPKIIPPDSTGMTGFRQESQGHDKDLDSDPIFIEISWIHERIKARACGFGIVLLLSSKKKSFTTMNPGPFGSYIFYDGWHSITAFVISGDVLYLIKEYGSLLSIHLLTHLINIMAPQQTLSPYTHSWPSCNAYLFF